MRPIFLISRKLKTREKTEKSFLSQLSEKMWLNLSMWCEIHLQTESRFSLLLLLVLSYSGWIGPIGKKEAEVIDPLPKSTNKKQNYDYKKIQSQFFTLIFTGSLSHFHFDTFTLSLSHFQVHTFTFTRSLLHFHTSTLTLSLSHFHTFTFTPSLSHFHFHMFTFTLSHFHTVLMNSHLAT